MYDKCIDQHCKELGFKLSLDCLSAEARMQGYISERIKIDSPNKNVMFMQGYELAACEQFLQSGLVKEITFLGKNQNKTFFHHTKQITSDISVLLHNNIIRAFDIKSGTPNCKKGACYIYLPTVHKDQNQYEFFDGVLNPKLYVKDYIIQQQNTLLKIVRDYYTINPEASITNLLEVIKTKSLDTESILMANLLFIKILEIQKHSKFTPILVFPQKGIIQNEDLSPKIMKWVGQGIPNYETRKHLSQDIIKYECPEVIPNVLEIAPKFFDNIL